MMKYIYLILLLILTGLIQPAAAAIPLDRIVAVVNSDVVLESELQEALRTARNKIQQSGRQPPPRSQLERQVLEQLVTTKLQLQMAQNNGIRVDDEALNQAIRNIASKNNLSLSEFRRILEQDGYNYENFRQRIRDQMTIARLRKRQVENRINVTNVEIENYLDNQEFQGGGSQQYKLSHILISVPNGASEAERQQRRAIAEKIVEEAEAGREFAELASEFSDGRQADEGGDLGWRKFDQIPSLFSDEVRDMETGDISPIVKNDSGFHVFELTAMRSAETHMVTQTHARHILLKPDQLTNKQDVRARLEQLRQRIKSGTPFSELARSNSGDKVSAAQGGDLGWISPGDLVPQFEEVMDDLEPGEISQPFQTQYGWHIVQVLERRERDNTEEYRRAQARDAIRKRKSEDAVQNWLREMREEAYVEYRLTNGE